MYNALIEEAKSALESDNKEEIIETIRKIMLSVPNEVTEQALTIFLYR